MGRLSTMIGCSLLVGLTVGAASHADPLPTIVTYELKKAQQEARALARDPKSFWVREIVARIEDKKPVRAQAVKSPMSVELGFTIGRDGSLLSKEVVRSSGDPSLDKEAVVVLERAAPFPPMPAALPDDHLAFVVPLRFK